MPFSTILQNHSLITGLVAWFLAQLLKPPLEYMRRGKWSWGYLLSAGGMPSSHSALMVGTTMGIGLHVGFDTPVFAMAIAITMVVLYDAAGVRREAGRHAELINIVITEVFSGHPISEKQLREVIGHTPMEVIGGVVLGLVTGWVYWVFFG